jgi:hypothetical protein
MNIETLQKIGGSEWKKGDIHRVYFNDLADLFGLECSRYGTGNISSATLCGEEISNSLAWEIEAALDASKIWFDVADGRFHYKMCSCRTYTGHLMAGVIIAVIKHRAAAIEKANRRMSFVLETLA